MEITNVSYNYKTQVLAIDYIDNGKNRCLALCAKEILELWHSTTHQLDRADAKKRSSS